MERGDFINILSVIFILMLVLVIGNLFNLWSLEGAATKCKKVPIVNCAKGMELSPIYKKDCIVSYSCVQHRCPIINKPECKKDEFLTASFDDLNCLSKYGCYNPECPIINTDLKCTENQKLNGVYGADGCVKYYICSDLNEHAKNPDLFFRINRYLNLSRINAY